MDKYCFNHDEYYFKDENYYLVGEEGEGVLCDDSRWNLRDCEKDISETQDKIRFLEENLNSFYEELADMQAHAFANAEDMFMMRDSRFRAFLSDILLNKDSDDFDEQLFSSLYEYFKEFCGYYEYYENAKKLLKERESETQEVGKESL